MFNKDKRKKNRMAIIDNINSPDDAPSFESIDKQPRVYRTDVMLYRLTRADATRLYKNNPPFTMAEQMNMQVAIKKYLNERERTTTATHDLYDYLCKVIEDDKRLNPKSRKFDCTQDDLHEMLCSTIFSYFYNSKYSKIANLKSFDMSAKDANIYSQLSFEELRYINIMKEELIKHHQKNPNETLKDYVTFAENLAITGRKTFIKTFKADPILIQLGVYDSDEVLKVSSYLDKKIAQEKKASATQQTANKAQ